MTRSLVYTVCACSLAAGPRVVAAQSADRVSESIAGGTIGGLTGILAALPAGCGGVVSDRNCRLRTVATGFAIGDQLGSAIGAARSGSRSSCSGFERFGLSLLGTAVSGGIAVAGVSRAHGNLRIGLTPLVQLAQGAGAAAMLSPCSWHPARSDSLAVEFTRACKNPSRDLARTAATLGLTGGYAGLYLYFHHAWWSGVPAPKWFVQNDWDKDERDSDKFGHLFGGYQLTRVTSELLRAGCMAPSRAAMWAALYTYAFQFQIEEWDGTQQLYGFNPSDLVADAAGILLAVAQVHTEKLRYIKPVWSYRPTEAYRRRNLPGHGGQPRTTTDYAGQTYWFSIDVHGLFPERLKPFWPGFVRLSPGYSITDYLDPVTGDGVRAKRRFLVSLDLDPETLPGDNKVWRTIKHELAFLRIPGPTLQLTPTRHFFGAYY